jgi:hypothetical protein
MSYWWENKPWRMIQTNMREIDMRDIDADQVVADLQAFQATAVLVNAAGIIASYPTQLPFQFQSPHLQGSSLQEIIAACHQADIRVLARTDFSKVRRPIYEQHPDWAYRTIKGEIVDYNGDVHVCVMGDYQQVYALEIIRELLTTHDFDGIFFNMGGFQTRDYTGNTYGLCHCAACRKAFGDMFGAALPKAEDMADPVYRRYRVFQRRVLSAFHAQVSAFIHGLRPEIAIDKDPRGHGFIRQESNTAIDRALPHWQYSGSANTKWAVSSYPKMVSSNTTVDFIDFPYRHVAVSPAQQELRLAQGLANGGAIDYYLIGRLDNHEDRSGYAPVKRLFHYHAAHGEAYVGNRSCATIALLNDSRNNDPECRGWYRVLTEYHHLFDTPQVEAADALPLERYRCIILPNLRHLSETLAARLDAFVEAGGTLIASGETAFADEDYEPRATPALRCLGIEQVEVVRNDMRSSYIKLDDKAGLARFDDCELVYLESPYVYARYAQGAEQRFQLVPPHHFGPPERCYYTTVVDRPGLVVNRFGAGTAIYLPWLPGQLFHRQGYLNTAAFVADVIEGLAGQAPVGGNLPPMVEVTLFENPTRGTRLLHLVNGTGHFGVSFYAPATLSNLEVRVPGAAMPSGAVSLVTGQPVPCHVEGDDLVLSVASLGLFEAIELR